MSGPERQKSGIESFPGAREAEIRGGLQRVAESWGTELPRDDFSAPLEFTLPVAAGLRMGSARLRVMVPEAGERLEWELVASDYRTHRTAVMVLLFGAVGGLVLAAWPFFPGLVPIAPLGVVLLIAAWLLVSARVKYRGVEQFWTEVAEEVAADRGATEGPREEPGRGTADPQGRKAPEDD